MIANASWMVKLNIFTAQRPLYLFLLIYRWASLLLAMWLFLVTTDVFVPGFPLSFLLALSLISTVVITVLQIPLQKRLFEQQLFLGADLLLAVFLLTFSGATRSPYTLYALNPMLVGALFFHGRGAIATASAFSVLYPSFIFVAQQFFPNIHVELGQLFTQLVQAWLVTMLFGSLSTILNELRQAHTSLTEAHADLTWRNQELAATYHQLEVIHELTLFLHAPDRQSIQQRLLKAIAKEFGFRRAMVGLVNLSLNRLDDWQVHPPPRGQSAHDLPPLKLVKDDGPLVEAVLSQQVQWATADQGLTANRLLASWFGRESWLVLPMVWQEQTLGVLAVIVDEEQKVDSQDDRWPILTSLVSQAAVALGTIDRTRRLAVEQERNRIARDIHDTVAQSLFGIVFTLDACVKLLPQQAKLVKKELMGLRRVASDVREEVRQSVLDLWPSELTREQFELDLEKYVKQCAPGEHFDVEYKFDGDFDGLPPLIRRNLYRVCQEGLNNAVKHARVGSARIYLFVNTDEVYMSIRDKGRGFDPKRALKREENRERFGLRGMHERIEVLGGTCDILSQEGYGTQVLVRVPIHGRNGDGPGQH